jgi:Uncharacterized conserved protein (some members contain a von Willebrand factor type A (vWA) domain)
VNLRLLSQAFSLRDLRNAALGMVVVVGGIALSLLTLYASQIRDSRLAGISATASLVFVVLILIFVVPPLARNAGREASQLNLPFEFTLGGAIMLGLIVIVGFSAWNTGNNLLFLVLSFLTAAMVVGFMAGNLSLKKLDVKMRFPESIFAAEETPILVSLHNRKRVFPSFSVVAEVRGKERERSAVADDLEKILGKWFSERFARPPIVRRTLNYFVYVRRNSFAKDKTTHIFERRGRFLIRDFELSTRFPFGFFRHRRRLPAREAELIVFPKLASLDHELENLPLDAGKLVANKRGLGQDLLALRDYQPNDDLRRIDWKATARARQLIVREFSAEDDKRVTIILDVRVPDESTTKLTLREKIEAEQSGKSHVESERFEAGVSLTASLITHFTEEQAEIRLVINHTVADFGIGRGHLYECLKRLAVAEPQPGGNNDTKVFFEKLEELIDERDNSHNIIVSTSHIEDLPPKISQSTNLLTF